MIIVLLLGVQMGLTVVVMAVDSVEAAQIAFDPKAPSTLRD
mgnify:CR=1 FL=1